LYCWLKYKRIYDTLLKSVKSETFFQVCVPFESKIYLLFYFLGSRCDLVWEIFSSNTLILASLSFLCHSLWEKIGNKIQSCLLIVKMRPNIANLWVFVARFSAMQNFNCYRRARFHTATSTKWKFFNSKQYQKSGNFEKEIKVSKMHKIIVMH